ncbi:hypothetical protein L1887_21022 [Cichorium endivia]|nr:hypothetical protein L1887_21022 [Cichorium endivia]
MDNQSDESYQENVIDQPLISEEFFDDNHDEDFVSNFHDEHQSADVNQENINNLHDEDDPVDLNEEIRYYSPRKCTTWSEYHTGYSGLWQLQSYKTPNTIENAQDGVNITQDVNL